VSHVEHSDSAELHSTLWSQMGVKVGTGLTVCDDQQHLERGSIQMVQCHMIYSPERKKKQWAESSTCNHIYANLT
jgi:hypothetical protein